MTEQKTIKDLTETELKALAHDSRVAAEFHSNNYQAIMQELKERAEEKENGTKED